MPLSLDGTGSITGIGTFNFSDEIIHVGDTNTKIRFPANDVISFETAGSERLRILPDGKVLIGHDTNIFNYKLAVFGTDGGNSGIAASRFSNNTSPASLILSKSRSATIGNFAVLQDDDEVGMIDFRGADGTDNNSKVAEIKASIDGTPGSNDMPGRITFHTTADGASATTERLRITSTGQLLVGTGSASNRFKNGNGNGATPKFQFETANVDEQNDISLTFGRNNAFGAEIILAKHRAATVGGYTVVQSGDRLGGINFAGSDGTHFRPAALIQSRVDGTPGTADMPGRLEFLTTADGAATPTEGLRIDAGGRIFTGNDTTLLNSQRGSLHISGGGTSGSRVSIRGTATGAGNGLAEVFAFWDTNKVAGMIAFAGEDTTNKDDGKLNFYTANGSGVVARMQISKEGYVTKPYQVAFFAHCTIDNHDLTGGAKFQFNALPASGNASVSSSHTTFNGTNVFNTSTNTFTAPVAGLYYFHVNVYFRRTSDPLTSIVARVNNSEVGNGTNTIFFLSNNYIVDGTNMSGSMMLQLAANDAVTVHRRSGNSGTTRFYGPHSHFCGHLIG